MHKPPQPATGPPCRQHFAPAEAISAVSSEGTSADHHPQPRYLNAVQADPRLQPTTTAASGASGPAPVAAVEALQSKLAPAVLLDSQAGQLGPALVALARRHAAAIAAQAGHLYAARDHSLWWRCEALDLRQQLDQARAQVIAGQVEAAQLRAQLAQVEGQAAQLRAVVEHQQRPTVPLGELRHLRVG
jgi:hypothetical protein